MAQLVKENCLWLLAVGGLFWERPSLKLQISFRTNQRDHKDVDLKCCRNRWMAAR